MRRGMCAAAALAAGLLVASTGCKQPSLDEMLAQKPRPAELDQLQTFVGTWESSYNVLIGKDQKVTGTGEAKGNWAADDRLFVQHYEGTAKYEGQEYSSEGMGIWMWDEKAGKFRVWWFSNRGEYESGTAEYDEETQTWKMKTKGHDTRTGSTWTGRGTMEQVDDDTLDWSFTMYDGWGLFKVGEVTGVDERQ